MATRQHICHRYKAVKSVLSPIWFADLKTIFGVDTIDALNDRLDKRRPARSGTRGENSKRHHKNSRGESLPNDDEIRLLREWRPSADRVPKLALWRVICEDLPFPEFSHWVWARMGHRVRRFVLDPLGGHYRNIPYYPPVELLAPLVRWCDPDAVAALLFFVNMRYLEKDHFSDDVENSTLKLIPHAQEALIRLSVFEPFRTRKRELFERVRERYFVLRSPNYDEMGDDGEEIYDTVYQGLSVEGADDLMDETLLFFEGFGRLGLIGSGFAEQVAFVNWFRDFDAKPNTARKKTIKDSMRQYCFVDDTGYIKPRTPMYRVLTRLGHPGTRSGRRIAIPRRHELHTGFRVANVLDGVRPSGERLRCHTDHRRSDDASDRSERSVDADKTINPDRRMQVRKPDDLIAQTGEG